MYGFHHGAASAAYMLKTLLSETAVNIGMHIIRVHQRTHVRTVRYTATEQLRLSD